jgi:hypothetical protein
MKKLLFISITLLLCVVSNAQTPYFYYYKGEKQYLSLSTEFAFLSLKETKLPESIKYFIVGASELQSDKSDKKPYQGKTETCRYWTELRFKNHLSEEQYLQLLSDIKSQNEDVIISPYFKGRGNDKVGLSNFFLCKTEKRKRYNCAKANVRKNQ